MTSEVKRLSTRDLNELFISSLADAINSHSDIAKKPLVLDLCKPYPRIIRLRVYLFNCTNPPGGRSPDEYKSQIIVPGQARGCRGQLDFSGDCIVILSAYASMGGTNEGGIFVLWDAMKHESFAYSANIQIKADVLYDALVHHVSEAMRDNSEIVYAARPKYLLEAVCRRIETA